MITSEQAPAHTGTNRSLWSETLYDLLYDAIQHEWSNNATREILKDLLLQGHAMDRILLKVRRRFGEKGVRRLYQITKRPYPA